MGRLQLRPSTAVHPFPTDQAWANLNVLQLPCIQWLVRKQLEGFRGHQSPLATPAHAFGPTPVGRRGFVRRSRAVCVDLGECS